MVDLWLIIDKDKEVREARMPAIAEIVTKILRDILGRYRIDGTQYQILANPETNDAGETMILTSPRPLSEYKGLTDVQEILIKGFAFDHAELLKDPLVALDPLSITVHLKNTDVDYEARVVATRFLRLLSV